MYTIRISGSNNYVSKINAYDASRYPPGRVDVVVGITHSRTKVYPTKLGAERAAKLVRKIEGYHCSIETV